MKVVGYEYPELSNEPYDSDWLSINIRVSLPQGSWSATDACLLTFELARLADWFESIAEGKPVDLEKSFMEPNLHFELTEDNPGKLKVYFELECRPTWDPWERGRMDDLWAEFEVVPAAIKNAANALREDLKRFPIRVGF